MKRILIGLVITVAACGPSTPTEQPVTLAEYQQVEMGMIGPRIEQLTQAPGELINQTETARFRVEHYVWRNPDGSRMDVTFNDGKAISKTQTGLH